MIGLLVYRSRCLGVYMQEFGKGFNKWCWDENIFWNVVQKPLLLQRITKQGLVAEWLGRGLQNLVQRFESARDLQINQKRT